jgi:acetyl-CoA acetyltransferase
VTNHPYRNVAIAAVFNTPQARVLEGHDSSTITLAAALGVLTESGMPAKELDGVLGPLAPELIYTLGIGPATAWGVGGGVTAITTAAHAITSGACTAVLVASGDAGVYVEREATAPWTRPPGEFLISFGVYTAVEFAMIARRHMLMYGTRPEHLATVAATIRNNGHDNPEASYSGRGPYTAADILASRMIADPLHLLDCSITSEGGCALLLTTPERAADLRSPPVYILGAAGDHMGPSYRHPPSWDLMFERPGSACNGLVGSRAARHAFAAAGIGPVDVDCCEFYDGFSFEVIRQFEAFGFCGPGEGPAFVMEGNMAPDGRFPTCTDGGLLSFSHSGGSVQQLQRIVRGVQQLQGRCVSHQVEGAEVALCSGGGAGALHEEVILLGVDRP